ncbi:MAG: TolC family protein [Bacteroidia bacterium]
MKKTILTFSFLLFSLFVLAQNSALSLIQCDSLALKNYPLLRQQELIEKSKTYTLENASKGYLPQISINGQATYQSEVLTIPISIPGLEIETPGKDQYKLYGEITQPLTDLYTVGRQKELYASNSEIQGQSLQVDLYKLKERVHQLFFGILLVDEQLVQIAIKEKDIESGITKTNAAITNGIAFKSSADVLKAELLNNKQRTIELKATRKAYADMLGLFINQPLDENTKLTRPQVVAVSAVIARPELKLYDIQHKNYDIQSRLLKSKSLPKFSLFFQSGIGKPAFNPYVNEFQFYYIGGLRLSWSLSNYYTLRKERDIIGINQSMIDIQRETFLFNTNLTITQKSADITRLQELINVDNQIVALRTNIKNAAAAQLENGVITSNDYLREVNAEDQSKQNLLLHEVQLLIANYDLLNTSGN